MLALTQKGVSREDAYAIVQRNAMKVWESKGKSKLLDFLLEDKDVTEKMSEGDIKAIFDYGAYTRHVESIITRALQS
jgi:adenylosuccinate lyase